MPILMLILTAVGGAIWWWIRANPRDAIYVAKDVATTVKNAPRKLAFTRQSKAHVVEGIDDPRIAICAMAQAFVQLDDLPTQEQRDSLHVELRSKLRCSEEEAQEMQALGLWLIQECKGPVTAIPRLARRLFKLEGNTSWQVIQEIFEGLVGESLSQKQIEAVQDIRLALRK